MFNTLRSSRQMLITGVVAVAALAGPVAGASAATDLLTLDVPASPVVGIATNVVASGTAVGDSYIVAYDEPFGGSSTCATTAGDEAARDSVVLIGTGNDAVAAGPFSNVNLAWTPTPGLAGTHLICGYLYGNAQPQTATPNAASPDVKRAVAFGDGDGDGVPDNLDDCPTTAGTAANHGCAAPVVPATPTTPSGPVSPANPFANLPAPKPTLSDPTGVLKLKSSKGKAKACGAGCLTRTRTVGPFSFALKVEVSGGKTTGSGTVTLTRKSAQAGKAGKVCLGTYSAKSRQTCKKVTWVVGKAVTLNGSITTPPAISKSGRPGFGITAYVGSVFVGTGASVYLKSAGGRIQPDKNESACIASAGAHAAC